MTGFTQKLGLVSVVTGLTLALSGCATFVVENPGGVGSCDSNPVTLVAGQNSSGETLSVNYTGPESAVLMLISGLYGQEDFLEGFFGAENFVFAWGDDDKGDVIRLDTTDPGWTVTGSGAATNYAFSGTADELFNGAPSWLDTALPGFGEVLDEIMPIAIAVDCDNTHNSGSIPGGEGWTFTAAQPLFPNSVQLDPFEVLDTALTPTGATATLRYAASAADTLGFTPGEPSDFQVYEDNPDVPNDTMSNLWSQAFIGGTTAGSITLTGTNPDGSFNVEISGVNPGEALADGSYLLFSTLSNDDATNLKVVFSSFSFSAATGLFFGDSFAPDPTLADTGVSASTAMALGVVGAAAIAGGAVLLVFRRRHAG
jgi:LPXTG-motif cell wall-anchored protein